MAENKEDTAHGRLSKRGLESYYDISILALIDAIKNIYDEKTNPDGLVNIGTAENRLMHKELSDFVNKNFSIRDQDLTYSDGGYGNRHVRRALADFLTAHLRALHSISPDSIVCMPGVTAVIETSAALLADSGDGLLLGRPYYLAFPEDINRRMGVHTVNVAFGDTDPFSIEAVAKYEEALLKANKQGTTVKGLILCSPHNPLGRCYSRQTLIAFMKLCQKYQIHFLSDEIYALSIWKNPDAPHATPFTSVLEIDSQGIIDKNLLHVFWGMSKDFCANGLRFGCIITSNQIFLRALQSHSIFTWPSSATEAIVQTMLSDNKFLSFYIPTNQARLSAAYVRATDFLKQHNIPYYPGSNAAFFLWVELRSVYLKNQAKEAKKLTEEEGREIDEEIQQRLLKKKVALGKGEAYGAEEGGWWRIVFSHPQNYMGQGLKRVWEAISELPMAKL